MATMLADMKCVPCRGGTPPLTRDEYTPLLRELEGWQVEGDKKLFNQYGVILVNPAKHPNVKKQEGQAFIDWLVSPAGQKAIAGYKIDGQQLFFPNANVPGA